jgi:hypothetical protein
MLIWVKEKINRRLRLKPEHDSSHRLDPEGKPGPQDH